MVSISSYFLLLTGPAVSTQNPLPYNKTEEEAFELFFSTSYAITKLNAILTAAVATQLMIMAASSLIRGKMRQSTSLLSTARILEI